MTDDWIQYRTETCQTGTVCVPHMVLPMGLGYLTLAFHVKGFQSFYVGSEYSPGLTNICQDRQYKSLVNPDFGPQTHTTNHTIVLDSS